MSVQPRFLVTDPSCFEVCYQINPWMQPAAWRRDPAEGLKRAIAGSAALKAALVAAGAAVETLAGVRGLPDIVFPANAAVLLDGTVLLARFRHPERQGEEPVFRSAFQRLKARKLVRELVDLPEGMFQEGAGDCIWDATRGLFWIGFGPRSSRASVGVIQRVFGRPAAPLELASERFYHLDTCFCPLSGGEVLYYPPAFTAAALAIIEAHVPERLRIVADHADAAAFCVNAVNIGRDILMARAPAPLKARLQARGYRLVEIDLDPFILSGGAAYCLTLRLDRASARVAQSPVRTSPRAASWAASGGL